MDRWLQRGCMTHAALHPLGAGSQKNTNMRGLRVRARLRRAWVRGECGWSLFGSPISGPLEIRCECCDRMLLRSELMSCAGCSRSVIRRHRVVVSAVSLLGMYGMRERDARKRGRDRRARSRWYVYFAAWLKI